MVRLVKPKGMRKDVVETRLGFCELHPDDARAWYLGAGAWCLLGDRERSVEWAKRSLTIDGEEPVTLYNVACMYARLGRVEDAIDCLDAAVEHGFRDRAWFENDTDLDPLREELRFLALLEKLV